MSKLEAENRLEIIADTLRSARETLLAFQMRWEDGYNDNPSDMCKDVIKAITTAERLARIK